MSSSINIKLFQFSGLPSSTQLEIIAANHHSILSQGESSNASFSLSPKLLTLNALSQSSFLGSANLSIDSLPINTSQIFWLRLNDHSASPKDLKVKLSVLRESSNPTNDCPYLSLLASGKADDLISKRLQESLKPSNKSFKINFDADAPLRLGDQVKIYEPENLAEFDSGRLEGIGGDQIKKQVKILTEETRKIGLGPVADLRDDLKNKVKERVDQENEFEKFTEDAVLELTELINDMCGLEAKRSQLNQGLNSEIARSRDLQLEIDAGQGQLGGLQREVLVLKAERIRLHDLETLLSSQQKVLSTSQSTLKSLQDSFASSKASADKARKNHQSLISKLESEAEEYHTSTSQLRSGEDSIVELNSRLKGHLAELKVKISNVNNEEHPDASHQAGQRYAGISKLQELQNQAFEFSQESKTRFKSALQQKQSSAESLKDQLRDLEEKMVEALENHLEKFLTQNELTYVEQSCCIQGDVSNLSESLSKLLRFYAISNKSALKYLDSNSRQILKETDNIKSQCNKIHDIMRAVTEKDSETDHIKAIMGEVKERHPPFIPKLDDPIDVALFEFIKSYEKPIPIPFTREEPGVYLFGTKRIFLKLENGNIVIRIGGGYTGILNFIEVYTSVELERQEEVIEEALPQFKSSQARFSHSPQKGMSPLRAARILQGAIEVQTSGTPVNVNSPLKKTPIKK